MNRLSRNARLAAALTFAILVAACGGGAPASPTAAPATPAPTTAAPPTEAPTAASSPTQGATGPASLASADTAEAGTVLSVTWTGPNDDRDYVTIVKAGATEWTNEDYFYTFEGSPGELTIPSVPGAYELWYVAGADESILARRPLTVTPFEGDLLAPDEVEANTSFEVTWNGPDGPGDYVTIVKAGATKWTNEDYFYTYEGNPGTLLAPLEAGAYEIWYVIGSDDSVQARRPITIKETAATLEAPASVDRGETFEVTWTGPDGQGDYVTIVPAGSEDAVYLDYFYTYEGNPGTLIAPDERGDYEVRYVVGSGTVVIESVPIEVK